MQRVKILSVTTRSKKIEVTGGFYSEEDMKNELGYSPSSILVYFGVSFTHSPKHLCISFL